MNLAKHHPLGCEWFSGILRTRVRTARAEIDTPANEREAWLVEIHFAKIVERWQRRLDVVARQHSSSSTNKDFQLGASRCLKRRLDTLELTARTSRDVTQAYACIHQGIGEKTQITEATRPPCTDEHGTPGVSFRPLQAARAPAQSTSDSQA